jgi:hypothetical protein
MAINGGLLIAAGLLVMFYGKDVLGDSDGKTGLRASPGMVFLTLLSGWFYATMKRQLRRIREEGNLSANERAILGLPTRKAPRRQGKSDGTHR